MHVQIRLPFFSVFFAVFHTSHRTSLHFICSSFVYQVLSITLDGWSDSDIDSMVEVGGNSYANSIYEAFLPKDHPKPKPDSSMEYRTTFIRSGNCFIPLCNFIKMFSYNHLLSLFIHRAKYETQDFLKPSLRISLKSSFKSTTSVKSVASTFSSTSRKDAIVSCCSEQDTVLYFNLIL
jgi:stromal membrane-associated protein